MNITLSSRELLTKILNKALGERRIEPNRRVKSIEFKKPNRRKTERREK
tara:strand:- start:917 stop:1063 length:147 start_codon:yes stop_codon:yes gene_type:complete